MWYSSHPGGAKLTIGRIRCARVGEDGSLMLADTYQWQDPGGVCAKYNWYQDFVPCLFIYLINLPVLESSAMRERPYLEL